jgi:aspartate racemase
MTSDERILGIVGGVGPESTIDYYRRLVAGWRRRRPDGSFPRVIIDSIEAGSTMRALGEGDFDLVGRAVGEALGQLAAAGCGSALISSNATHLAFDRIQPPSPLPMLHIVDAALGAARAAGHRRLGIIGTRFVTRSRLYADRFEPAGIEIVVPPERDQELVHAIYMGELVLGVFRDDSRERLVEVIAHLRDHQAIDGVILGGTELALILTEPTSAGVAVLDTAGIHVEAALDWLVGGD